ncbi:MAG: hypothetical protein WD669_01660 [Pirellulales bacterium]
MELWESMRFGMQAIRLRRAAAKPREEIERIQRSRLDELVRHAREHSDFYREKLSAAGESDFALTDLPTVTKSQLMQNFDRAVTSPDIRRAEVESFLADESNLGKYFRDEFVLSHTSGSQGQPMLIVQTKENLELLFALHAARGNRRLGVGQIVERFTSPARLAAVTLKRGFYPSGIAFEYLPEGARRYIQTMRVYLGDDDMLERLQGFRPTHLTAYASVLHHLARQIEQGRLTLQPELEQVVNISERLMPKAREHYAKVFGAPILDDYAMGECLFLSNGCAASGGMHVNADWAILEVVDEGNRPVAEGAKAAKVLLTNLANFVQPFIRYEVGDIVTMAAKECGCGSNLPLIKSIEGRDSDMFWMHTASGDRPVPPAIFDLAMAEVVDAREYQVIQEANDRIRVLVEPLPGVEFDRGRAQKVLDEQLEEYGLAPELKAELEVVERLAPESGSKFKRFVSKLAAPH